MRVSTKIKAAGTALVLWSFAVSEAAAFGSPWGGSGGGGGGFGGGHSAPEIDGPGGITAIALLVSAGLIAYNRFKK